MELALALLLKYKYVILFPLAIVEGPLVSLVVGFLVYEHVLQFLIVFPIVLFADILPDTLFWAVGSVSHSVSFISTRLKGWQFFIKNFWVVERLWTHHPRKTMFFAKLAYGLALPFLISAGMARMPYKKFLWYSVPVTVLQYTVIMSIGYLLGGGYALASSYIRWASIILAFFVIACIGVYSLFGTYARKKVVALEEKEKRHAEQ